MESQSRLEVQVPSGRRSIDVPEARTGRCLTELLRDGQLPLNTRCGQRGLCDGCLVELVRGTLIHAASGKPVRGGTPPVTIRGCEHHVAPGSVVEIRVPARSLLAHSPQVVTSFRINVPWAHDPICDPTNRRGAGELAGPVHGAALDIGTTTVVALLVDLTTGEVVSEASALNAQSDLGDNVLTRINLCMSDKSMIARLQDAVVQRTIYPLLEQTLDGAGVEARQLACLCVAGNTTMLHLVAGIDPTDMGLAPFTPTFLDHRVLPSGTLAWQPAPGPDSAGNGPAARTAETAGVEQPWPDPTMHLLPGAAAYVGADVVAGVLSSGMIYRTDTCMLVDVGTNGEIVLKHGDQLLGCATAAGPAFEGSGLRCGVRAGDGAISHIRLAGDPLRPEIDVIGQGTPIGLCGTAYVDFVAQAYGAGLIGATGRYVADGAAGIPVEDTEHGRIVTVAHGRGRQPIFVSEGDIASLLQAKAAIAAGIVCLLRRVGLKSEDVTTLLLAGGFGFHMNVDNAIGCGLLPGFRREQIQLVGNSSLAGAYLSMMDSGALNEVKRIGARLETIELNLDPAFESQYIDQLAIPQKGEKGR